MTWYVATPGRQSAACGLANDFLRRDDKWRREGAEALLALCCVRKPVPCHHKGTVACR